MTRQETGNMGEAARAATKRFSWMEIAPEYERLYRQVLKSEGRAA
jgi:alpha-1,3-mannosyltransferase